MQTNANAATAPAEPSDRLRPKTQCGVGDRDLKGFSDTLCVNRELHSLFWRKDVD